MLIKLFLAWCSMALCVALHAGGVTWALRWLRRRPALVGLWPWTGLFIRLAWWIVLLHLVEIAIWALVYRWGGALADVHTAFYFSAVTYTTTGYGDVTLPREWHLVGGVEALTGILMCGWSTGFFFAIVNRMAESNDRPSDSDRANPAS